jgi:hypothetical protein
MGSFTINGTAQARGAHRVDARLIDIIESTAAQSPYNVELFSGKRNGGGRSRHDHGKAIDIVLVEPKTGRKVPNLGAGGTAFQAYEQFAHQARAIQTKKYPKLNSAFRWGGYFGPTSGLNPTGADLMHFDIKRGGAMSRGSWEGGLNATGKREVANLGSGRTFSSTGRTKGVLPSRALIGGSNSALAAIDAVAPTPRIQSGALAVRRRSPASLTRTRSARDEQRAEQRIQRLSASVEQERRRALVRQRANNLERLQEQRSRPANRISGTLSLPRPASDAVIARTFSSLEGDNERPQPRDRSGLVLARTFSQLDNLGRTMPTVTQPTRNRADAVGTMPKFSELSGFKRPSVGQAPTPRPARVSEQTVAPQVRTPSTATQQRRRATAPTPQEQSVGFRESRQIQAPVPRDRIERRATRIRTITPPRPAPAPSLRKQFNPDTNKFETRQRTVNNAALRAAGAQRIIERRNRRATSIAG